jgi:hypothetical protein
MRIVRQKPDMKNIQSKNNTNSGKNTKNKQVENPKNQAPPSPKQNHPLIHQPTDLRLWNADCGFTAINITTHKANDCGFRFVDCGFTSYKPFNP